jgi:hypothetical protein
VREILDRFIDVLPFVSVANSIQPSIGIIGNIVDGAAALQLSPPCYRRNRAAIPG